LGTAVAVPVVAEDVAHDAVKVPVVAVAAAAAAAVVLASAVAVAVGKRCQHGLPKAPSSDCRAREWSKKMLPGSPGALEHVGGDGVAAFG
jgi:hypothetical protein